MGLLHASLGHDTTYVVECHQGPISPVSGPSQGQGHLLWLELAIAGKSVTVVVTVFRCTRGLVSSLL